MRFIASHLKQFLPQTSVGSDMKFSFFSSCQPHIEQRLNQTTGNLIGLSLCSGPQS